MSNKPIFKNALLSSAILSVSLQASASNNAGMIESLTGFNINDTPFLKDSGLEVGGWASAGATYTSHNRSDRNNAPLSFNDRNNELLLNQFNLFIERAVNTDGNSWDIGGRIDVMYGTDAQNTQAAGWDGKLTNGSYYDFAVPQMYAEVYAPIGNGITAKIGHFYTSIGYEVVTSPDNFFYSHAYTMLYAEPFTHTGVSFSYDINDNFSINAGAVQGWDNVGTNNEAWSFLGGTSWTSDDEGSSVVVQVVSGDLSDEVSGNTTMYSIVASHDLSNKLHYVFQHDYGVQRVGTKTDWYGINQYLTYDISEQMEYGVRLEWFGDKGGAQRVNAVGANYFAIAAGINYSPVNWMTFRPEVRYDRADEKVFNGNSETDQISVAMDVVISF